MKQAMEAQQPHAVGFRGEEGHMRCRPEGRHPRDLRSAPTAPRVLQVPRRPDLQESAALPLAAPRQPARPHVSCLNWPCFAIT
jgi:hypothetical protein